MSLNDTIRKLSLQKEMNLRLSPPRGTLFSFLAVLFLIGFLLFAFSIRYALIVTVPLLALWSLALLWFVGVWHSFGYLRIIPLLTAVLSAVLGLTAGRALLKCLWEYLSIILP